MSRIEDIGFKVGTYLKDIPFENYSYVYDDHEIKNDNIKITNRLGSGCFSTAYSCIDIKTGIEYAFKVTCLRDLDDTIVRWGESIHLAINNPDICSWIHKAWIAEFDHGGGQIRFSFLISKLYTDTVPNGMGSGYISDSDKDTLIIEVIKKMILLWKRNINGDYHFGNWMYSRTCPSKLQVRLVDIDMLAPFGKENSSCHDYIDPTIGLEVFVFRQIYDLGEGMFEDMERYITFAKYKARALEDPKLISCLEYLEDKISSS